MSARFASRVLSAMVIWTKPLRGRRWRVPEWRGIGGSRLARLEEESVLHYHEAIFRRSVHGKIDQHPDALFAKSASGKASQAKID